MIREVYYMHTSYSSSIVWFFLAKLFLSFSPWRIDSSIVHTCSLRAWHISRVEMILNILWIFYELLIKCENTYFLCISFWLATSSCTQVVSDSFWSYEYKHIMGQWEWSLLSSGTTPYMYMYLWNKLTKYMYKYKSTTIHVEISNLNLLITGKLPN